MSLHPPHERDEIHRQHGLPTAYRVGRVEDDSIACRNDRPCALLTIPTVLVALCFSWLTWAEHKHFKCSNRSLRHVSTLALAKYTRQRIGFVFGGSLGRMENVYAIYDDGTVESLAPLLHARMKGSAVRVGDSIYLIGGSEDGVHRYDIAANEWAPVVEEEVPTVPRMHVATIESKLRGGGLAVDTNIYCAGSSRFERLYKFNTTANPPQRETGPSIRRLEETVEHYRKRMIPKLVRGTVRWLFTDTELLGLDIGTLRCAKLGRHFNKCRSTVPVVIAPDRILLLGGHSAVPAKESAHINQVSEYIPSTDEQRVLPWTLPNNAVGFIAMYHAVSSLLYIFGGDVDPSRHGPAVSVGYVCDPNAPRPVWTIINTKLPMMVDAASCLA
jgi:hypothetical protein